MNTAAVNVAIVVLSLGALVALVILARQITGMLDRREKCREAQAAEGRAELDRMLASQARFTASLEELRREFEREVALDLTPDAEEPAHSGTSIHTLSPKDRLTHRRSLA